ncbi:hypothetical protein DLH72_00925 [Candidatus Gracilibacteria bacterium]|nr:MAG: hypothetical protein DLH72_00925 [Candidatus Gracilibacteria bacterium]
MAELNKEILIYINSFLQSPFWFKFSYIFSDGPIFFLPIFLVGAWIFWTYKIKNNDKKKVLLFIFYTTLFAVLSNLIFQRFFHFERPEGFCPIDGRLIIDHIPDASFPSDHAAVSFAFLFALFLAGYRKTALVFAPFVIFMNLSRIMACVHWPFDILAGALVGIIWAFIVFKLLKQTKIFDKLNNFILKISSFIKL